MSGSVALAVGLLLSVVPVSQTLPDQFAVKPGEDQYCRGTFKDLQGHEFHGAVRAWADGDTTMLQVYEENPEYKAETAERAFEYGTKRRSTITIHGRSIGQGDVIVIDDSVSFIAAGEPASPDALKFTTDVAACIANAKKS